MSSIPNPVKKALTVLAGACDELSRVIRVLPEVPAEPEVLVEPVAALGAGEGAGAGPAQEVKEAVVPALGAGEGAGAVVPAAEAAQPAAEAAQGPAQEVAEVPAVEDAVVPAVVPGAAQPDFKEQNSVTTFKTWGSGRATTNYFQIMNRKIDKFFKQIDNKIANADPEDKKILQERKVKYERVKQLLQDATTEAEVNKIIEDNQVEFDSNSITSGGTRKPRMHRRKKTQRKRSKTIKKKPKSGNRK